MCFDDKGRIYVSAERKEGMFRVTPPPLDGVGECKVELVSDQWGHCQGMSFINGALYVVQHGSIREKDLPPGAILRLKDTDGDDKLDTAEPIFLIPPITDGRTASRSTSLAATATECCAKKGARRNIGTATVGISTRSRLPTAADG
jgi:hypothetical protein